MQLLQKLFAKYWFQVEYLKAVLLLENAIPKKSNMHIKRKNGQKGVRESGIFMENTVNKSHPQTEAPLFEK